MIKFNFYHLRFLRGKTEKQLVISGEIENLSGKDCNSVAVRAILFGGSRQLLNTVFAVRGLNYNQIKMFYHQVNVEDSNTLLGKISRHEMHVESVY
jgi:hypothetical protein